MVSKKELLAELDKLGAALKAEREAHEHTCDDVRRLKIDNDVHRARERSRMRREHAEQQRARQEAEREDRRKRRQELSDGMLRLADASEWAIVNDERGKVLELTVPLRDVEPVVHGVLTKQAEKPKSYVSVHWGEAAQRSYQALTESMQRIRLLD